MSWGSFDYEGESCDLTHLDPFTMQVSPKAEGAPTWRVLVSFGHHTFTRDWRDTDKPEHKFTVHGDDRCFCAERYPLSVHLPGLVTARANGKAYFTQGRNFMFVEALPGLENGPYCIFFTVKKAESAAGVDAVMFIDSAYAKPGLPPRSSLNAVTVPTIVSKALGQAYLNRRRKKRSWKAKK